MRCITVINQKGGVGKTTTVANLGVALARRGHRVLLVDLDPQAHLTMHLGIDPGEGRPGSYSLLAEGRAVSESRWALSDSSWIMPSHLDLAAAETELVNVIGRETILRDALARDAEAYEYVLIDCPPSLGLLTLNGLCAAHEVLIPLQAHFLALQGVSKLLETIRLVHSRINPDIRVGGVLLCIHDAGTRLGSEVAQDIAEFFADATDGDTPWSGARLFETVIRRNIKLAESPSHGLSVFDYAPKSNGAQDYADLAEELLVQHRGGTAVDQDTTVSVTPERPPAQAGPPGMPAEPQPLPPLSTGSARAV